jgi:hypothetical protein
MGRKAKLIRVNFTPAENVAAFIVAFVDNEKDGFKKIVKEAYSNWSTDNNINWEEKQLKVVTELSSYSFVANVDLDEKYSDWEDFYILHFQKTSDYKVR